MADNKVRIIKEVRELKKEDFLEVLSDCKNCKDPLVIRIQVKESKTPTEYYF